MFQISQNSSKVALKPDIHGSKFDRYMGTLLVMKSIDWLLYNHHVGFFPGQSVLPAIACNTDHWMLMAGRALCCANTIAQQEWFPHPHIRVCTFYLLNTLVDWNEMYSLLNCRIWSFFFGITQLKLAIHDFFFCSDSQHPNILISAAAHWLHALSDS